MATSFCISSAVILKAGANAPSLATDAEYTQLINQAEGIICAASRYDWLGNWATISASNIAKYFLEEVCSDIAAIYLVQYDMNNYTSRIEAEDMVNILRDSSLRGLQILRNKQTQKFIVTPATGTI